MRLLLIRHGQTPNNILGALDTGRPGAGLTELGHEQARAIPAAVAEESIAALYVSPLVRTQETAAPLAEALGLEARVIEGFEEILAGDAEMHRDAESVEAYQQTQAIWGARDFDHALAGGEDGHTFWARYTGALAEIAALHPADATVAVVSHGAAIRVFATLAAGLEPSTRDGRPLHNTGMVTLEGHPEQGWQLVDWNNGPLGGAHLLGDVRHDVTADENADAAV
ncbi:MAG: histidine phosphatase family protein [Brachybacterium tyrofermentans]